ncbi:hypothetical protein LCGC14_1898960 [marine sediment metagenome]|uniref:Uncharacterized protein n=1 Tax=marine sediment metagenome TaxID=412755 RepID=A0A0F9GKJ4_9ZZZZ
MDKEIIDLVYRCYLGKTMGKRLGAICKLVKEYEGKEFFKKYSMPGDSIIEFLEKCEKQGLKLW